jgi:probable O-glycosylation ligase (exosortase A-associated)
MPIKGVLLLAYFVISLPFCFVRPFYGIVLWTVIAFLNPQSAFFYWSVALLFPWALAVAIPTITGSILFCAGWTSRLVSRECLLLLLLWLWFTVTTVAALYNPVFVHHADYTKYLWVQLSKILLMTAFTIGLVNSFARLRALVLTVAGCFGFFVAKSLPFVILTGGVFRLYGPDNSMISDNNDFGLALNMTLPMYFFLAQTEDRRMVRWLFGVLCLMTVPAVLFTYSRGALVGLAVLLLMMFVKVRQRFAVFAAIAVAAIAILTLAPASWKQRMDPTKEDVMDASAQSRLTAWGTAWHLAKDFPITGGGFGTFTPEIYARYSNSRGSNPGPHSIYFQVLAEHGFLGLALYLAVVLCCFADARQLVKQGRREGDNVLIHYTNMFRFGLIGFLVSGSFLGRAYFDYFFLLVACFAILRRLAAEAAAGDEETESASIEESVAIESEVHTIDLEPQYLEARRWPAGV